MSSSCHLAIDTWKRNAAQFGASERPETSHEYNDVLDATDASFPAKLIVTNKLILMTAHAHTGTGDTRTLYL